MYWEKNESDKVVTIDMIMSITHPKDELRTNGNSACLAEHNS